MTLRSTTRAGTVALLVAALALGACSDDDDADDQATAPTSTETTEKSGPAAGSQPEADAAEGCAEGTAEAAGKRVGPQVTADVDGDEVADTVSLREGTGGYSLQVDTGAGGALAAPLPIEDRSAEPRLLGGHDVDGDGGAEVFAELGRGASATTIGLATVTDDCRLEQVRTEGGSLAVFPVGASAATQQGVECTDDGGLVAFTSETRDGQQFDWSSTSFTLDGSELQLTGTNAGTYRSPGDDDRIRRLGTLTCGTLTL